MFQYTHMQLIIFYYCFNAMVMLFLMILKIKQILTINFRFKLDVGNSTFDILISTIIKTIILIHFRVRELEIQYLGYVVLAYYILRVFIIVLQKIILNVSTNRFRIYIQGLKVLLAFQLMLITIKWKEMVDWNWFVVFSVIWSLLVIFFIFHLILILSTIETTHEYFVQKASKSQLIGGVWLIIYFCGFSGIPSWFCYIICNDQETVDYPTKEASLTLGILIILQSFLVVIISTVFKQHIKNYILDIGFEEENQSLNVKDAKQQPNINIIQKPSLPKKLIQVSSTYFEYFQSASQQSKQNQNITNSNYSIMNQRAKLKAFDFVVRNDQLQSPEKESNQIQYEQKCQVCYTQEPIIVMLPCRHGGICYECLRQWLQKSPNCYICRQKINQICKVHKDDSGNFTVKDITVCYW
ncbi:unnamed protein product (macronuclear) [Paramecium tetraurelia]|uniref:Chromosome undetermined scaffold_1, whole genome shotgun sequence n=1 Tax=Paramecium tetraurelia TaxID=5888 RepID=Q6BFC8_PARTE|nr:hypothetical protein [Paramecium tetraurelia strain d4-2]XP_001422986.1 uncharacterized protein GSPATT00000023001 [Paramecium tetraurelia]CAH03643.1 hypothetical protein, RING Zn-finger domain, transmembrane helices [Paramecium tetraurelia]CAK55588.1 unnamed protein product [Paramecium tetraurelia]|eukprot:XP_001422986.1 hypothetical protein (macronuclear) [Paramecium tetraurelia strain d4-2]